MSFLPDLQVLGTGAISPSGYGAASLLAFPGPGLLHEALLRNPETSAALRRVNSQSDSLRRWQQEPRLRRASPLALFLMEAASQALENHPGLDRQRLGLVCALGTGSICYSRRFFVDTLNRGRRFASPALFPETVYNSPVSHVATILGIREACYSLIGDETAWVEALRVAQLWLALKKVDHVLVLGGEELDAITVEAFSRAGWLEQGVVPSEGAGAVLVAASSGSSDPYIRPHPQTATYRSKASQHNAWQTMLDAGIDANSMVLPGNIVPESLTKALGKSLDRSGPDWGAAFTASASWATLQMLASGRSGTLLVPGSNCGVTRLYLGP